MKTIILFTVTCTLAAVIAACGGPAANNGPAANANTANANANAAKPTAAAPTADTLLAMDKQANEAYFKGDSKFFEGFLGDKFTMIGGGQRVDKAAAVKMISGVKCDIKEGWKLDDPQMAMIDADTYVLSYKGTFDGTCTENGKTEKAPSPTRAVSVYTRSGDKWVAVFHGENVIVDPTKPPPAAPKMETKKPEASKDTAKKDDKAPANSNTAANAAPAPAATKSANTDALAKVELAGWEAWKAKDAKKLDEVIAKNLAIVGSEGAWMGNRADIIKYWTDMPCKDVKNVAVKDPFGIALSPTTEMLVFNGSADGTCYGQKNGTQPSMSIYVKEGDAWKLAFGFSGQPAS